MSENERVIVRAYLAGGTLRELGQVHGVTGERIRQIVASSGITDTASRARAARARLRAANAPGTKPRRSQKRCVVCGRRLPFREGTTRITDSSDCAQAWPALRFSTREGKAKHDIAVARYVLRNPDRHDAVRVRWAEKVLQNVEGPTG